MRYFRIQSMRELIKTELKFIQFIYHVRFYKKSEEWKLDHSSVKQLKEYADSRVLIIFGFYIMSSY